MKRTPEVKFVMSVIIASLGLLLIGGFLMLRPAPTFDRSFLLPDHTITRGAKQAPVYLVEFSDFQCPACKAFTPVVKQIIENYGDSLVFGYRHFPLDQHAFAKHAALAFEAAREQEKAWDMYEYLFSNQSQLSEQNISEGAKQLGLNLNQFEHAMISQSVHEKIDKDIADAMKVGVNSTPTFFLNGQKLNLFSPEDLITAVDEAVANKN